VNGRSPPGQVLSGPRPLAWSVTPWTSSRDRSSRGAWLSRRRSGGSRAGSSAGG